MELVVGGTAREKTQRQHTGGDGEESWWPGSGCCRREGGWEGGLYLGTCRLQEAQEQKRSALQKLKHLWDFSCHGQLKLNLSRQPSVFPQTHPSSGNPHFSDLHAHPPTAQSQKAGVG